MKAVELKNILDEYMKSDSSWKDAEVGIYGYAEQYVTLSKSNGDILNIHVGSN